MGQQQLLITILVTIIIGVAAIVATNTMQETQKQSNESAVRQDILMIINDAYRYYKKPAYLGGGGNSFNGISEEQIVSLDPTNENGSYSISGAADSVIVKGSGTFDEVNLTATASLASGEIKVRWSE